MVGSSGKVGSAYEEFEDNDGGVLVNVSENSGADSPGCETVAVPRLCVFAGPCYPCPLVVDVSCACGKTKVTVPCGAEKSTHPPRCRQPCR